MPTCLHFGTPGVASGTCPVTQSARDPGPCLACGHPPQVSPELRDFICQLLEKDVLKRLDIHAALQHPWVTLGGSAPLLSIRQQQLSGGLSAAGGSSCSIAGGALEATQEEIDAAIKQIATGGVSELMDVVFAERVLQPG